MSIETHIHSISQKRSAIKQEIAQEMGHPHPDLSRVAKLKKLNLRLKEEMFRSFKSLKSSAAAS